MLGRPSVQASEPIARKATDRTQPTAKTSAGRASMPGVRTAVAVPWKITTGAIA
jgi:hypothetical protein